jgi:plastocyanin
MKAQPIILGAGLLMLAGCQTIGGESMPTVTRTGEVKDVIIRENVDPTAVTANPGDEIRFINKRQADVRVIFLNPITENLACQRNFGGVMGFGTKRNEYAANLGSNKTASVCFRDPGEVKYVVRAESGDMIGEQNLAGSIFIGGRDMARDSTVSSNRQEQGLPTLTRTGEVKDVIIRDGVEPTSVTVNAGDEIRWINKRQGEVRVILLSPMAEKLVCQRNFGGRSQLNESSAKLGSNESASLCFRDAGEVKYVVRAASNDPIGEQNLAGTIKVEGDMARNSTTNNTRQERRASHVEEEQPASR